MSSVVHFYREGASRSSRIQAQISIDGGRVVDYLSLLDFKQVLSCYRSAPLSNVLMIFHQQYNLANLLFMCLLVNLGRKDVRLVYDIHDLNEYRGGGAYKYIRFLLFGLAENIVFRMNVKVMTVSKGLSKMLYLRHRIKSEVYMNMPVAKPFFRQEFECRKKIIYFGRIYGDRLPISLLKECISEGFEVSVYGVFAEDKEYEAYIHELKSFIASCDHVEYCGEYTPENIGDILKNFDYSLVYFPSDSVNLRYCLPNKVFQSLSAGVACICSKNLREVAIRLPPQALFFFGEGKSLASLQFLKVDWGKVQKSLMDLDSTNTNGYKALVRDYV